MPLSSAINQLKAMKILFNKDNKRRETFEIILNTLKKYQKIEDIANKYSDKPDYNDLCQMYWKIMEIVEDVGITKFY